MPKETWWFVIVIVGLKAWVYSHGSVKVKQTTDANRLKAVSSCQLCQ
jgi:hypothetical protein